MAIIKDGRLVADDWRDVEDDEVLADSGPLGDRIIVSLTRWQREKAALAARNRRVEGGLGVRLRSDELADALREDLDDIGLVAVTFPKVGDGRGYSTARLLRERFGFRGEIRARGHLIRDQFLFLDRCGVDAIELSDAASVVDWQEAMREIGVFYQSANDVRPSVLQLRHGPEPRCGIL